ncbi:hypothetical protein [Ferrimonas aestuarii]|uniref:AAA domain-containing protein n=1 Tax=Ferrimonas aestuarii TaxID=2569539 RepID=A0A4U1BLV0_9GAMM|nr:hypothetical protein [Ferrimonas aestuarii]TKB53277.1 hypothetical protein FCL42_14490 [Ferrimonas aestuarii]
MQIHQLTGKQGSGSTTVACAIVEGLHLQGFKALLVMPTEHEAEFARKYRINTGQVMSTRQFDRVMTALTIRQLDAIVFDGFDRMTWRDGCPLARLNHMSTGGAPVPRQVFTFVNQP